MIASSICLAARVDLGTRPPVYRLQTRSASTISSGSEVNGCSTFRLRWYETTMAWSGGFRYCRTKSVTLLSTRLRLNGSDVLVVDVERDEARLPRAAASAPGPGSARGRRQCGAGRGSGVGCRARSG